VGRSLADVFVSVLPKLDPNAEKDIKRKLSKIDAEKDGKKAGQTFGHGIVGGMKESVGKAGVALAGVFAVGAVVEGLKSTVGAASDLNETVSKSNTIFGKASGSINKFASNSAKDLGLSREAALSGLSAFGNFFDQIGIGTAQSVKMSKGLVSLSSDLASFNNADPAAVMEAFQAATRGEYDSLQAFIPTVSAATVQTEALRQTHKKSATDLTNADKATALYAIAQRDAGKAVGDFARTSGGAANQQRIMNAQLTDAKAKIGQAFLPAWTGVLKLFNRALPVAMRAVSKAWTAIKEGFLEGTDGSALSTFGATVGTVFLAIQTAAIRLRPTVAKAFAVFQDVLKAVGPILRSVIAVVGRAATAISQALSGNGKGQLGGVVAQLKVNFGLVVDIVRDAMILTQIVVTRVVKFIAAVWRRYGDIITRTVLGVFGGLYKIIGGALKIIRGILDVAIGLLSGDWKRAWKGLASIAGGALDIIKGLLRVAWAIIRGIFQAGIRYLHGLWSSFWADATKRFKGALKEVADTARFLWTVLKGIFRNIVLSWLDTAGSIVHAAAKAFGWVPGVGPKLRGAAREFDKFRASVNRSLGGIDDEKVNITARFFNGLPKTLYGVRVGGGAGSRRGGITATLAGGGPVYGPGTSTSDSIPAMLSNGEHVWTAKEVSAAGGHGAMESMRSAVRGFAAGGAVDVRRLNLALGRGANEIGVVAARAIEKAVSFGGRFNAGLQGGLAFAKAQAGKPYIWGGVGPRGYDCSGFMSAIWNVVQGRNPYHRRFATGSFPVNGWVPGPGAFMIGSRRGNPGHMAGTINGVNVESSGSIGAHFGRSARGALNRMFDGVWHLRGFAKGGAVRAGDAPYDFLNPQGQEYLGNDIRKAVFGKLKTFDTGGWLPPGLTMAHNGTGRPERILGPGDGAGTTIHIHGDIYTRAASGAELVKELQHYEQRNGKGWRK
jgi:hypothetical protein